MMDIKPAEISSILRKQIADFGSEAEVAEVGQVLSVGGWNCTRLWPRPGSGW